MGVLSKLRTIIYYLYNPLLTFCIFNFETIISALNSGYIKYIKKSKPI
jgi:hypothetical protein